MILKKSIKVHIDCISLECAKTCAMKTKIGLYKCRIKKTNFGLKKTQNKQILFSVQVLNLKKNVVAKDRYINQQFKIFMV